MSRAERLLLLMQLLRTHRIPVSGEVLSRELGVSLRTVYRDIASLQAQGADITGTSGVGFVLKPGFLLPPLMFTEHEIEALVLGMRWVAARTDPALARSGSSALARIAAVLPADLRAQLDQTALFVPAIQPDYSAVGPILPRLREAIRTEVKIDIGYKNEQGMATQRVIWPIAVAFFEQVQVVSGWCELRESFRNFRIDRITGLALTTEHYPRDRAVLLQAWRLANGIKPPS